MKKLCSNCGETLLETIAALLVATLVLLCLATAIAAATRVNKNVRESDVSFHYSQEHTTDATRKRVEITDRDGFYREQIPVYEYTDRQGNYRYYKEATGDE